MKSSLREEREPGNKGEEVFFFNVAFVILTNMKKEKGNLSLFFQDFIRTHILTHALW